MCRIASFNWPVMSTVLPVHCPLVTVDAGLPSDSLPTPFVTTLKPLPVSAHQVFSIDFVDSLASALSAAIAVRSIPKVAEQLTSTLPSSEVFSETSSGSATRPNAQFLIDSEYLAIWRIPSSVLSLAHSLNLGMAFALTNPISGIEGKLNSL